MTGLMKLAAVGAVSAIGYTALRLSRVYNNLNTTFGIPHVYGILRTRFIGVTIPAIIYNYSGQLLNLKRLRIEVSYKDNKGNFVPLGISPRLVETAQLLKDKRNDLRFDLELDAMALAAVQPTTPIKVLLKFNFGIIPLSIPYHITINDFIPPVAFTAIKSLLKLIGLGNPSVNRLQPLQSAGITITNKMGDVL
ncbi:MAG: hypothetical protein F9K23_11645 [Bacteroidetes bacterium]|nr:MAG: hypothetical protein F9K23_11645 [Bacteroidota bacterium]